jgi:hypothetical protein
MSERRPSTGGGLSAPRERPASESVARLSDHLGRLLAHADRLLAEWQAHAEGLRGQFEKQGEAAGEALARALEAALADAGHQATVQMTRALGANAEKLREDLERARQAAADLEAHMRRISGGAKPTSVDELRAGLAAIQAKLRPPARSAVPLAAVAALLSAATLLAVLLRPAPEPAPAPAPPPAAPAEPVAVVVPDAAPPPPPPPAAPCTGLRVDTPTTAAKLARACQTELCGPTRKLLASCERDDPGGADLVAALLALSRERPFEKLTCAPPRPDGEQRYAVTVRWLLGCAAGK